MREQPVKVLQVHSMDGPITTGFVLISAHHTCIWCAENMLWSCHLRSIVYGVLVHDALPDTKLVLIRIRNSQSLEHKPRKSQAILITHGLFDNKWQINGYV